MFSKFTTPDYNLFFKGLFDNYKDRVYGYVLKICRSPYAAEEITQEIFMKLWFCRDLLHEIENPDAYIFRMAKNKTLNYLRQAKHDEKLLQQLQQQMKTEENDADQKAVMADYERLLREALALVSPQRRQVYQLSRIQGLSYDEIAAHLQLSRNTVRNHLVEALRFIRTYMGNHHITILLLCYLLIA